VIAVGTIAVSKIIRTQGKIERKGKSMAAAYSEDLRICIIKAYKEGQESVRQLADRFHVGKSFIGKLIKRYKETGSIGDKPFGGGEKPYLNQEDLAWLKARVEASNGSTLAELCVDLETSRGKRVSQSSMCRALQKIGM
jgi:transposase